jgi:hypothetical protein
MYNRRPLDTFALGSEVHGVSFIVGGLQLTFQRKHLFAKCLNSGAFHAWDNA